MLEPRKRQKMIKFNNEPIAMRSDSLERSRARSRSAGLGTGRARAATGRGWTRAAGRGVYETTVRVRPRTLPGMHTTSTRSQNSHFRSRSFISRILEPRSRLLKSDMWACRPMACAYMAPVRMACSNMRMVYSIYSPHRHHHPPTTRWCMVKGPYLENWNA